MPCLQTWTKGKNLPLGPVVWGMSRLSCPVDRPEVLCFLFFSAFGFLASWLLGFLASWLLGFLASWLLGFLAFRLLGLLGFWASGLFGFLLVYAFGCFLPLRILCIPSSSSSGGVLAFAAFRWFMRLLAAFGGVGFSHPSGFLTSWGQPPPNPPTTV